MPKIHKQPKKEPEERPNLDSIDGFMDGFKVTKRKKETEDLRYRNRWGPARSAKASVDKLGDFTEDFVTPVKPKRDTSHLDASKWKPGQSGNPTGYCKRRKAIEHLIDLIDEQGGWRDLAEIWLNKMKDGDFQFFREFLERRDGKTTSTSDVAVAGRIEIKVIYANAGIDGETSQASCWPVEGNGEDAPV